MGNRCTGMLSDEAVGTSHREKSMRSRLHFILPLLVVLWPAALIAAPAAEPWPRWEEHDPQSAAVIEHEAWTALLEKHLHAGDDGIARFDYAGVAPADRRRLEAYIDRLSGIAIGRYNRDQQLAYWINLYNALTVDVVLEHHPVDSIRDIDISPGFFSRGPWGAKLVEIEGVELSLDDIEHRILRPVWRDPRIHYAVNCAALGCPNLQPVAFTADNAERLLDAGARAYVNHPRGASFENGELIVSSIYHWFREDFGGTEQGVIAHLIRLAEPALRERLAERDGYDDHRYDWRLNALR